MGWIFEDLTDGFWYFLLLFFIYSFLYMISVYIVDNFESSRFRVLPNIELK